MNQETITALAASAPPRRAGLKKLTHHNIGEANTRIASLEKSLGLEPGKRIFGIVNANARIEQLESILAQSGKGTTVTPATTTTTANTLHTPVAPKVSVSTATLGRIACLLWPSWAAVNDRAALATSFWKARLTYPGCEGDFAAIPATAKRHVSDERWTGANRSATASNQAIIDREIQKLNLV